MLVYVIALFIVLNLLHVLTNVQASYDKLLVLLNYSFLFYSGVSQTVNDMDLIILRYLNSLRNSI